MNNPPFTLQRLLACAVGFLVLQAGVASAQSTSESRFEEAHQAYERNHWADAYTSFVALADSGHPKAARIAWHMWRHGQGLYNTTFPASVDQVQRWSRLADCDDVAATPECDSLQAGSKSKR